MRNEWKAIKTLLQQSCCKKKWLWSAAFICLGIVWKILSLSGRPEVAEDFSPLFFAVAGIMPMEILLVNDISKGFGAAEKDPDHNGDKKYVCRNDDSISYVFSVFDDSWQRA